jgi:hypothetical protein
MAETGKSLPVFQTEFARFLLAVDLQPPAELRSWLAGTPGDAAPARRINSGLLVYRNNVIYSLTQALAAQFPVVHKLVGADFFGALARDYVRQEPPLDASLTYYGHLFPAFIESVPACRPLPYLADVATLELQCQRALHAADDPVLAVEDLAVVAPEQLGDVCFTLHSSACLFASDYPVDRIWTVNLDDSDEEIRLDVQTRHHMLIYRRGLQVQVVTLQPPAFTLLHQLQLGENLEQACSSVLEQHELDNTELTPLLGYLLGLEVFSRFKLLSATENA